MSIEIKDLSEQTRLMQLAEESVELAHASLKLLRILDGKSPTPITQKEARKKLTEEMADVLACLMASDFDLGELFTMVDAKLERWETRLRGGDLSAI